MKVLAHLICSSHCPSRKIICYMKILIALVTLLFLVGCHKNNVSLTYRANAIKYGESWISAFRVLGVSGLEDAEAIKQTRIEFQPILDKLKSTSVEEKKIYDEALYVDRALAYLSENTNKPIGERYSDQPLNIVLGIKESKLPEDPSVLSKAFGNILNRYMNICR